MLPNDRRGALAAALACAAVLGAHPPTPSPALAPCRARASGPPPHLSDARRKTAFRDVGGEWVLGRLAALPVRTWQYRAQAPEVRHIGPTAQDFRRAFSLGESDTTITGVDADGVALAGVQALERRTRELRAENAALRAELAVARRATEALRRDVAALWSEVSTTRRPDAPSPVRGASHAAAPARPRPSAN
jgi:hypothetical protein